MIDAEAAGAAAALLRLTETAAELTGKPTGSDRLSGVFTDIGSRYRHETHAVVTAIGWIHRLSMAISKSTKITYTLAAAYHFRAVASLYAPKLCD
jgi:hypothetical protein